MNWIGELFKLIGGSQENVEESRAREDADRLRKGASQNDNMMFQYIVFGLLLIALVLILIFVPKK